MTPCRISISCTWRSSEPFDRRHLVIVIDVYIYGEEVPGLPPLLYVERCTLSIRENAELSQRLIHFGQDLDVSSAQQFPSNLKLMLIC